eukprot:2682287-Rhodomonas_salina.2
MTAVWRRLRPPIAPTTQHLLPTTNTNTNPIMTAQQRNDADLLQAELLEHGVEHALRLALAEPQHLEAGLQSLVGATGRGHHVPVRLLRQRLLEHVDDLRARARAMVSACAGSRC